MDMQLHTMLSLTGAYRDSDQQDYLRKSGFLSSDAPITDVCNWTGCLCTDGSLTSLVWPRRPYNTRIQSHLSWYPSTLIVIKAESIGFFQKIPIRHLPKKLEKIMMPRCCLQGSLEMDVLPRYLEVFQAPMNLFVGTVVLKDLPLSMRVVDLQRNSLTNVYLDGELFPEGLKVFFIDSQYGRPNAKIHWLSGVPQDGWNFEF